MESEKKYAGSLKWRENSAWYDYDEEKGEFVFNEKAPVEARSSFEQWKELKRKEELRRRLELEWRGESEWYDYDEEAGMFILTERAPVEARRSFEQWKRINGRECSSFTPALPLCDNSELR